jgi:hypothetical protein
MGSGQTQIPVWGLYMMLVASALGTGLLFAELARRSWPAPWKG